MEAGWIKISSSSDLIMLEMYRQRLEDAGIYSVLLNKKDSELAIGYAELYVHESNEAAALGIIEK
ncbi:MAG: DUF2007 domain-containing protein [Prevotellaceae bacterium]|jgi:hypothetical protein|nr:DUF2007 domain-containing protein [Prevotellaceae bacterium]